MKDTNVKACDGLLVISIQNGNGNGDPADDGNPRRNSHTGLGIISGECTKRKVRDYTYDLYGQEEGYDLFIKRGAVHEPQIREAYETVGALEPKLESAKGNAELIRRYFDARWFGLVVTNPGAGRIHGPLTVSMGQSIYPIFPEPYQGTRVSTASEARSEQQGGRNQEFVNRRYVSFGVYVIPWHLDPFRADRQGFIQKDLDRFIEAVTNMYRSDHSSTRGEVTLRKHIIFEHAEPTRCAEPMELFESVRITAEDPERAFDWQSYRVDLPDPKSLPVGVTLNIVKD
jgi:CRISPR-associated protein Csd2